jgi:hypothetical protein
MADDLEWMALRMSKQDNKSASALAAQQDIYVLGAFSLP